MDTLITPLFQSLASLLSGGPVVLTIAQGEAGQITVSVIPKPGKEPKDKSLGTPLCCTGTAEELDRELPHALATYVRGVRGFTTNLEALAKERAGAEEELRKLTTAASKKATEARAKAAKCGKEPEENPAKAPQQPLTLFDEPLEATEIESI